MQPRGGMKPAVQPVPLLTIPDGGAFASAPSPLETSLFVGSGDLVERIVLSLLVIAYGQQNTERAIEDPEHDAQYLRELFEKLDGVHFQALSDNEATFSRIDESIRRLWHQAPPNSHLLLLLTGHGNDNAMELYGPDEVIDESYLNKTFQALYRESPKEVPVTIIFDICRDNKQKLVEEMDDRVALVWTCSLGQKSFAIKFRSFRMPRSLFLIGLFMASSDVFQELGSFEERLKLRIDQLARFNRHVDHVSGVPKCMECIPGRKLCAEAFVMKEEFAQIIDLSQSQGRMSTVFHLIGQKLPVIQLSETISRFLLNNKPFLSSNDLPLPATSQRGANKPSSQAPTESTKLTPEVLGV
ncbi:hypothetical protein FRC06_000651 [Ceratobasidium sp. 370]|nr:hypothetical protein FRC06_000651 [Ceratobasidium sp. 370]